MAAVCTSAGRRADNPAAIRRFHEKPRTRRLSPDEADRLRAVLDRGLRDPDIGRRAIATYVTVAMIAGARRSAISAMRWADLDLRPGQGTWTVPAQWSKNGGELRIALVDRLVDILAARRDQCPPGQPWVFPSAGQFGDRPPDGTEKRLGPDSRRRRDRRHHGGCMICGAAWLRDRRRRRQRGDDCRCPRPYVATVGASLHPLERR